MNTKLSMVAAEVTFLRDTLRQTENSMVKTELKYLHQALILSQTKILKIDVTQESKKLGDAEAITYH